MNGEQHDEEKISKHLFDDALKCTKKPHVKSLHMKINDKTYASVIKGEEIKVESSGLSKREWNELMSAFGVKGKLLK